MDAEISHWFLLNDGGNCWQEARRSTGEKQRERAQCCHSAAYLVRSTGFTGTAGAMFMLPAMCYDVGGVVVVVPVNLQHQPARPAQDPLQRYWRRSIRFASTDPPPFADRSRVSVQLSVAGTARALLVMMGTRLDAAEFE